jgi:hypothetical protein
MRIAYYPETNSMYIDLIFFPYRENRTRPSIFIHCLLFETKHLWQVNLQGGVYFVKTKAKDIGARTRGVTLTGKSTGKSGYASEFYEDKSEVKTRSAK